MIVRDKIDMKYQMLDSTSVHNTMSQIYSVTWEVIQIRGEKKETPVEKEITPEPPQDLPRTTLSPLLDLKNAILQTFTKEELEFQYMDFLNTDLLGNIELKSLDEFRSSEYSEFYSEKFNDKTLGEALDSLASFTEIQPDEEALDIVLPYLFWKNKTAEAWELAQKHESENQLSFSSRIFFILAGFKKNDEEVHFTGEEEIPLNILYKYKYGELARKEKNVIFDAAVSGEEPGLIGLAFVLFKDTFRGIRNIQAILGLLSNDFDNLKDFEKKEFISIIQKTNSYFNTYSFMKKVLTRNEIKAWLHEEKKANGKILESNGDGEKLQADKKYKQLKQDGKIELLTPFEILLVLNSSLALQLKEDIIISYEKSPESYSTNRAVATLHFFENDFKKFLMHLAKSGSLKNSSESLYLKGLALREIGMEEEGNRILRLLSNRFPDSEVIKSLLK